MAGVRAAVMGAVVAAASAAAQPSAEPEPLIGLDGEAPATRASGADASLAALVDAARRGDTAAAEALLSLAYDTAGVATTRAEVFEAAARAVAEAGDIARALAWTEWSVAEAARAGAEQRRLSLESAIEFTAALGERRAALIYARAYAALGEGVSDEPYLRSAFVAYVPMRCPDWVGPDLVRRSIAAFPPPPGAVAIEPAQCAYAKVGEAALSDLVVDGRRSFQDPAAIAEAIASGRLRWFDAADPPGDRGRVDRDLARTARGLVWLIAQERVRRGAPTFTRVYAVAGGEGVIHIATGTLRDADWPPQEAIARVREAVTNAAVGPE